MDVQLGSVYQHYLTGNFYQVIAIGMRSDETEQDGAKEITYVRTDKPEMTFTTPYNRFIQVVENSKGQIVPRFELMQFEVNTDLDLKTVVSTTILQLLERELTIKDGIARLNQFVHSNYIRRT